MELSAFTYIAKDFKNNEPLYFKEILFGKSGEKVYIEITCGVDMEDIADGLDMGIMEIVIPFNELMKHKHLKAYYELSLKANNKDRKCDTIYIIEDTLTNTKEAKIGESCHLFNMKIMKKMVLYKSNIANYDARYGFE